MAATKGITVVIETGMADNVSVIRRLLLWRPNVVQTNDAIVFPECNETHVSVEQHIQIVPQHLDG